MFELPGDKVNLKIEKLSGDVETGGRLAGWIKGGKTAGEKPYAWHVSLDVAMPEKVAAAGPSCGS